MPNGTLKNILIGAGGLFDFFPAKSKRVFNLKKQLGSDGMFHDFQMVGKDMWYAIIEHQNTNSKSSNRGGNVKTKNKDGKTIK